MLAVCLLLFCPDALPPALLSLHLLALLFVCRFPVVVQREGPIATGAFGCHVQIPAVRSPELLPGAVSWALASALSSTLSALASFAHFVAGLRLCHARCAHPFWCGCVQIGRHAVIVESPIHNQVATHAFLFFSLCSPTLRVTYTHAARCAAARMLRSVLLPCPRCHVRTCLSDPTCIELARMAS